MLVIEPHPVTRRGIRRLLSRDPGLVLEDAGSLGDALQRLADGVSVALIIVEPLVAPVDHAALIATLAEAAPGARILALSARVERSFVARVLKAGAAGFVAKSESLDRVRAVVESTLAGERGASGPAG